MQALQIDLRASLTFAAILFLAHGAVFAIIVAIGMPAWSVLLVLAILILSWSRSARQAALRLSPNSTVAVAITANNVLSIQTRRGDWIECQALGSSYVAWFLTVLNVREIEHRNLRHVVILPDAIDAEQYRQLRVWLRWQQGDQAA